MLDYLEENPIPSPDVPNSMKLGFNMLDDGIRKKHKKHKGGKKKHGKNSKAKRKEQDYAQALDHVLEQNRTLTEKCAGLAFHCGVEKGRSAMLETMIDLAVSAKRGYLDDVLLDTGMTALARSKAVPLPER